jgi:hypothetical protein
VHRKARAGQEEQHEQPVEGQHADGGVQRRVGRLGTAQDGLEDDDEGHEPENPSAMPWAMRVYSRWDGVAHPAPVDARYRQRRQRDGDGGQDRALKSSEYGAGSALDPSNRRR